MANTNVEDINIGFEYDNWILVEKTEVSRRALYGDTYYKLVFKRGDETKEFSRVGWTTKISELFPKEKKYVQNKNGKTKVVAEPTFRKLVTGSEEDLFAYANKLSANTIDRQMPNERSTGYVYDHKSYSAKELEGFGYFNRKTNMHIEALAGRLEANNLSMFTGKGGTKYHLSNIREIS